MPDPIEEVMEAVTKKCGIRNDPQDWHYETAVRIIEAARPIIEQELLDRLTSDEIVEAAAKEAYEYPWTSMGGFFEVSRALHKEQARAALHAAVSAIRGEQDG